ncbi:hypothetical protein HMPREF9372_1937 [Sporosarcina newyorkensis 2681]|uniref:Uncharacterized protein n=2 Tax=Sporosarcina newyorkensis TaxID=759851 RepID=A0A1T4YTI1_9BACL|nr:hypothetical protein HMPREF9372_1937 [Sporosarcina newyorkensis 2681]SKB04571.1 hypothetical protein SAMN04244570_3453 [Sporosarcina newyorkensis]
MNCENLHKAVSIRKKQCMIRVVKELVQVSNTGIKIQTKKENEQHVGYHIVRTRKRTDF